MRTFHAHVSCASARASMARMGAACPDYDLVSGVSEEAVLDVDFGGMADCHATLHTRNPPFLALMVNLLSDLAWILEM